MGAEAEVAGSRRDQGGGGGGRGGARSRCRRGSPSWEAGGEPLGRSRSPGGGRKSVTETDPGVVRRCWAWVEPGSRGDPELPLRWTTLSPRNLAAELGRAGHKVSAPTVARLLREEHFSLQGNAKAAEGRQHPDLGRAVPLCQRAGRRPPGRLRSRWSAWTPRRRRTSATSRTAGGNGGRRGPRAGERARLQGQGAGKVTPYGVYDIAANAGWVSVGTDHYTAAFAVQTIRTWWRTPASPPTRTRRALLICADGGGSNGYRTRLWKTELAALAEQTGLDITVCQLPARHLQVEQNRAPAVQPHLDELALAGR